ncbi:MAG: site-specific DNA-methyltransferase, partial [Alphaproteobacteria bacterium]|nr:site-specific DNA-methyltransferase [Alphaproteobacteria bacterium]
MRSGLEKPSQADAAQRYDGLSRDELLRLLLRRDRERRLGLVWERERFGPDRGVNDDFVVFDYEPDVSVVPAGGGPFRHLIIEGENYDALRALRATLAGRVRCILIDPPYNTGARDWSYDDDRIDPNDAYRQSKWLEWLWRRL